MNKRVAYGVYATLICIALSACAIVEAGPGALQGMFGGPVLCANATTGQVPTRQADGSWQPATPSGGGGGGSTLQAAYVASSTIVLGAGGPVQISDANGTDPTTLIRIVSPDNTPYTMRGSDSINIGDQDATGLYFKAGSGFHGATGAELDLDPGAGGIPGDCFLQAGRGGGLTGGKLQLGSNGDTTLSGAATNAFGGSIKIDVATNSTGNITLTPPGNNAGTLGGVILGGSLHLPSAAGLSWNNDTFISRASSGHFNFGASLGGQDGWLLAQKMALTDTGTGKEVDFDISSTGALALTSGAWLRFDNTGISQVSTSTIAAGNTAGDGDATVSLGTPGITTTITASTSSPVDLPATSEHTNTGSSVDIIFNLPAAPPVGTTETLIVTVAHYMKAAAANDGTVIYLGVTPSASGGFVRSNAIGSTATFRYAATHKWVAVSVTGTWTVDS